MKYENLCKMRDSFVTLLNACLNKDPICGTFRNDFARAIVEEVDAIVKIKPRKHGRWVPDEDENPCGWVCDKCYSRACRQHAYCPHCGAKMEVDDD